MNDEKKTFIIRLNLKLKLFLLVFVITICVLIGMIVLSMKQENVVINKYESDYINFMYDNNFYLVDDKEYIELHTKDDENTLVIKKIDYTKSAQEKDQYEIAASLSYQVTRKSDGYIETYNDYVKDNHNTKYYYLYENYEKERQIEVISIFEKKYIFIVIFSCNNSKFDLYKESIDIIIDSIEV